MKKIILIMMAFVCSLNTYAQSDTNNISIKSKTISEIKVESESIKIKSEEAQTINTIQLNEIKRTSTVTLEDAINTNIPGVFMQKRTYSAGQQFNIRGYGNGTRGTNGLNSNFDGQGYKVYLNGIPITDAEGITLMDDIDFAIIEKVDILKGPSGSLYGQAIAGTVLLNTFDNETKQSNNISQELTLGEYGLLRSSTRIHLGNDKIKTILNYGYQEFGGFMPHTKSTKRHVNMFNEIRASNKTKLNSFISFADSYDERNGELTIAQYDTNDYSGNKNYIKNNGHSNVISLRAGISLETTYSTKFKNTLSMYSTGISSNVSSGGGWTDKGSIHYGFRENFNYLIKLNNAISISGNTGIEAQSQNSQTIGYSMVTDSFNKDGYNIIGNARSNQYAVSNTYTIFNEWKFILPMNFNVVAGISYSNLDIKLFDRFYSATNNTPSNPNSKKKPESYHNSYDIVSPRIAINKIITDNFNVFINYSSSGKAPVSSYFFIPVTGEVIRNLKPEYASQIELGLNVLSFKNKLSVNLNIYNTHYKDKMTTIAVPNASNTATSYVYVVNGGEQIHNGVEFIAKYKVLENKSIVKNLQLFGNLNITDYKYGTFKFQQLSSDRLSVVESDFSNKIVPGNAAYMYNLGFDFNTTFGLYGNLTYSYRDKVFITSDNSLIAKENLFLNSKLGYNKSIGKHLNADVSIAFINMTSNKNYVMVFVNQLPDAYIPAIPDLNLVGNLRLSYSF